MQSIRNKISVSGAAFILLAVMVLLLPLKWLGAVLLAALVHEVWHYLAVRLCGGHVDLVEITPAGAIMHTGALDSGKAAFCALAGPIGALSLLFLARHIPRTAFCVLIHSAFNLLPVYPLDGGRALFFLGKKVFPGKTGTVCRVTSMVFLLILAGLFIWLRLGVIPILLVLSLYMRSKKALALQARTDYNNRDDKQKGSRYERPDCTDSAYCPKACAIHRRRI